MHNIEQYHGTLRKVNASNNAIFMEDPNWQRKINTETYTDSDIPISLKYCLYIDFAVGHTGKLLELRNKNVRPCEHSLILELWCIDLQSNSTNVK